MASEPRVYGEEVRRGADAAMDGLSDAVSRTRSQTYRSWESQYVNTLAASGSPDITGERVEELLTASSRAMKAALPSAAPFFVSAEAQELLNAARASIPVFRVDEPDLITRSGFAWFAEPYPRFYRDRTDLVAVSWTLDEETPMLAHVAAYTRVAGGVVPYLVLPLPLGEVTEDGAGSSELMRLVITFWLLSGQRLLGSSRLAPSRPTRRRRQGEIESVVVVDLRRKSYPETSGSRTVEWSHRWLTRGHWRNQWYPSEGRHKPVWVASYVKGPPDKPFVAKRRAFEFTR